MAQESLWKIADVAEYLGVPRRSIYKMTGPKSVIRIPHMRIAGKVRFRKTEVDRWLDQFAVSTGDAVANFRVRRKQGLVSTASIHKKIIGEQEQSGSPTNR
jgi:excisionase family DNA binding protein